MTNDAAGNVNYDNQTGGGFGYSYNDAGRMEDMAIAGVVQAEYLYDVWGQQVVRRLTQAGQTIHSVHDLDGNRSRNMTMTRFARAKSHRSACGSIFGWCVKSRTLRQPPYDRVVNDRLREFRECWKK